MTLFDGKMFFLYFWHYRAIYSIFQVATRKAFGTALLKLGRNNHRVINVDGDVKNSTFSIDLEVRIIY